MNCFVLALTLGTDVPVTIVRDYASTVIPYLRTTSAFGFGPRQVLLGLLIRHILQLILTGVSAHSDAKWPISRQCRQVFPIPF